MLRLRAGLAFSFEPALPRPGFPAEATLLADFFVFLGFNATRGAVWRRGRVETRTKSGNRRDKGGLRTHLIANDRNDNESIFERRGLERSAAERRNSPTPQKAGRTRRDRRAYFLNRLLVLCLRHDRTTIYEMIWLSSSTPESDRCEAQGPFSLLLSRWRLVRSSMRSNTRRAGGLRALSRSG